MNISFLHKITIYTVVISAAFIFSSCKTPQTAASVQEQTAASVQEQTAAAASADTVSSENAYDSADGWQIRYQKALINYDDSNAHSVRFNYTDSANADSFVKISYIADKQPEEVLAEITADWGNVDAIKRSQHYFPGTKDKWGFWRALFDVKDGKEIIKTAAACEYNGGVLTIESVENQCGQEAQDKVLSDTFSGLIQSISYKEFKPQKMYEYVPGTYLPDNKDIVDFITLNKDYTGILKFKDEQFNVLWGSNLLYVNDGTTYEYSIEGEQLNLKYGEQWISLSKTSQNSGIQSLPAYQYPGDDPIHKAVTEYIVSEFGSHFPKSDICIPSMTIIHTDTSNPDDILVWGDFWVFTYKLDNDTLLNESGGSFPGLIHLKKSGENYTVTKMDVVADGADNLKSAKIIFGKHYDAFLKINSNDSEKTRVRMKMIYDYINSNKLPIAKIKDSGWNPVELPF